MVHRDGCLCIERRHVSQLCRAPGNRQTDSGGCLYFRLSAPSRGLDRRDDETAAEDRGGILPERPEALDDRGDGLKFRTAFQDFPWPLLKMRRSSANCSEEKFSEPSSSAVSRP